MSIHASPLRAETTLYGSRRASASPSWSLVLRPIRRLTPNTVRCGFVTICRLLAAPTTTSPSAFHDTIDGVVRPPSWLWMTTGSPASSTATHEFVVPRSIPITRPIAIGHYNTAPGSAALAAQVAQRDFRELELGIELERTLELHHGVIGASRCLRLTSARVTKQRPVLTRLRDLCCERVECDPRRGPIV